jgi:hypothetical protein
MNQLAKMALLGLQLLSSTVIGQDNYGDPAAPLLLPSNSGKFLTQIILIKIYWNSIVFGIMLR